MRDRTLVSCIGWWILLLRSHQGGRPHLPPYCRSYSLTICFHASDMELSWVKVQVKRPSGEGNGTPLQYSCLENPMDGGAW